MLAGKQKALDTRFRPARTADNYTRPPAAAAAAAAEVVVLPTIPTVCKAPARKRYPEGAGLPAVR